MGKRKSSSKPMAKKRADPLATSFKCVFCHRDRSVSVKMDKQEMYGHLNCKECGQRFSSPINNLSSAIDVYCDWKDACEEIRLKQSIQTKPIRPPNGIAHGVGGGAAFNAGGRAMEKDADRAGESDSDGGRKEGRDVGYLDDDGEGEDEDDAEREAADVVRRKEKKRQKRVVESDEEDED